MNSLSRFADPVYCIMRLIVGLMFACHGVQLALGGFGGMPGSDKPIMVVGGWIQLVFGILVALGLLTRPAAFIASGEMAVAYFMMHVANAPTLYAKFFPILNHGEMAVLYCWIFLFIFFLWPWPVECRCNATGQFGSNDVNGLKPTLIHLPRYNETHSDCSYPCSLRSDPFCPGLG